MPFCCTPHAFGTSCAVLRAQVPVLFTGTLRFNLTPFGEHSDAECWAALRRAHLAAAAEASPLGLDLVLREGGAPLSAGQKQLVALARALLRHAKVRQQGSSCACDCYCDTKVRAPGKN